MCIRDRLLGFTNARHLTGTSNVYSDYGAPEYIAPEMIHRYPVSLTTDMWNMYVICCFVFTYSELTFLVVL